jgi:hypothetical protein
MSKYFFRFASQTNEAVSLLWAKAEWLFAGLITLFFSWGKFGPLACKKCPLFTAIRDRHKSL